MTQPSPSTSLLLCADHAPDTAIASWQLGWGERVRALALHAVCWALFALMVLPLLPPEVQSAAARGMAWSAAYGQEWASRGRAMLPLEDLSAPEHPTCVPVCVHVEH